VAAYLAAVALLGAAALAGSEALTTGQLAALWTIANAPGTLMVALSSAGRVRAVGPLVLAFLLVAVGGAILALHLTASLDGAIRALAAVGVALGLSAPLVLLGVTLAGALTLAPLGYLAGRWLGRRYEAKRISDATVTVDAVWIVFAMGHAFVLVAGGGPGWLLAGVGAFAAYKLVTLAGFRLLAVRAPETSAPRLLVLRAFSLGRRSERLFGALAKRWRHAGPLQLISGPDLATATVEPHEFLDFLHGRLSRRFVDGPVALERLVGELDVRPDPDGRYRVNELFCYDDVWRLAFSRLLDLSDGVVMDVRGFSRDSPGLSFELQELVRTAPLDRVVLLADGDTDREYLEAVGAEAWRRRAAAPSAGSPPLTLVELRRPGDFPTALRALCDAVASPRPAGPATSIP
ncbi:MAG: hypothetical protein R3362_13695, partial [Rhodothermales bacterium]|nr:hypothetical protein [Rhodothermales bacterium]